MQMGNQKTAASINVTPMIDILLVLLIAFMIMPTKSVGLKSDIPQPAPENQPSIPDPQNVVVRILSDRSIEINTQPVILADLHERLQRIFASRPDGVLFVDGADDLFFEDVAVVIDAAHGAGINRIGLIRGTGHSIPE
jgi:biopolymer transport protein TolR